MEKLDVSIIIVNYNTMELTRNCLKSVFEKTEDIDFEVIVSDNGSSDGSVEMIKSEFPQVVLIENNANLGFGAANNCGLRIAKGKYVFYLNSDTVLLNNAVKIFFDYWENSPEKEKIGALGSMLQNENGNYIHSFGEFPTYRSEIKTLIKQNFAIIVNQFLSFFHIPNVHKTFVSCDVCIGEVDYVTGANLFVANNSFAKFDEQYFLYFEETDLEWQLKKHDLKRYVIDKAQIIHLEGKSNNTNTESICRYISFSAQQILVSRLIWFKKNRYVNLPFLMLCFLSLLYLSHIPFFSKTSNMRKRIISLIEGVRDERYFPKTLEV